ncbi:MAG: hypothetical protein Q9Q13_04395 [Acidobacteriota bacterium]|nr:hypothetical protein [Acidobacteriota bacterium]
MPSGSRVWPSTPPITPCFGPVTRAPPPAAGDFAYTLAPALRSVLLEALEQAAGGESAAFTPEVAGFAQALVLDRVRHGWREELHDAWRSLDQLLVQPVRPFGDRGAAPAAR